VKGAIHFRIFIKKENFFTEEFALSFCYFKLLSCANIFLHHQLKLLFFSALYSRLQWLLQQNSELWIR